ncbi:MAG: nucleotidyltransferase family protein [Eubacterium sp.]|nr:nucleotidyltransferase family protein [Eubacterium sp.]
MKNYQRLFLEALKASLFETKLDIPDTMTRDDWEHFFQLAGEQNMLPYITPAFFKDSKFLSLCADTVPYLRSSMMQALSYQTQNDSHFLRLYNFLAKRNLSPVVVKGIICRSVLPNSELRTSSDEDIYIPNGSYESYKSALLDFGMQLTPHSQEVEDKSYEVSYVLPGTSFQIEVHVGLFNSDSKAFQNMNDLFCDVFEHSIIITHQGTSIRSMSPTDHALFLILHALKHFLGGGFGIRLISDLCMYCLSYGHDIDWSDLKRRCELCHSFLFATGLFEIGHTHLGFDYENAGYPALWQDAGVDDIQPLLNDLLDAGIFGASNMTRKHSANMTVQAYSSGGSGKPVTSGLLRSAFPPLEAMQHKYPELKEHPVMLPFAWLDRIAKYRKETAEGNPDNNVSDSIKIGKQRIELMRKYGLIE